LRSSSVSSALSISAMPASRSEARRSRQTSCWRRMELAGAGIDGGQLLRGRQALARRRDASGDLAAQARDANHVKLVKIARRDRQKPQPFEQRMPRIGSLVEHAFIESKPGQFPVDVAVSLIAGGPERSVAAASSMPYSQAGPGRRMHPTPTSILERFN
jgi:hypothetical protein